MTTNSFHRVSWEQVLQDIKKTVDLILAKQEAMMAAVDDELAAIKASLDTINTGVQALLAKIAAMPTAGLTPAQQAALDAINVEAQGIATAANPPPPAPAPAA